MRNLAPTLCVASVAFYVNCANAEDNSCSVFFNQDIHDKLVVVDNKTGKQISSSSFCEDSAEASSTGVSVSYAGASIGFDQAKALARAMCDNKFSQSDILDAHSVFKAVVDPAIIDGAVKCFELSAKGLHYDLKSSPDTHSINITFYYTGPNSVKLSDIVIKGNAECEGQLYEMWKKGKDRHQAVPISTEAQGMVCSAKELGIPESTQDIEAGSISIFTTAGPIYAELPRRFSPTLEQKFDTVQSALSAVDTKTTELYDLLSSHVLASAIIYRGQIKSISSGASFDLATGTLSFPKPHHLAVVPIASEYASNQTDHYNNTGSCWVQKYSESDSSVVFGYGAQDTSDRIFPVGNCSLLVIAING